MKKSHINTKIPSRFYTDESAFASESELIFKNAWQFLGRINRLKKPGAFFTTKIGATPLIVLRDKDGKVIGYDTNSMFGVLGQSIKELNAKVEAQQREIVELEVRLKKLESK